MGIIDNHAIKRKIENIACPLHDRTAIVTVADDKLNITCCCETLQNTLKDIVNSEIDTQSLEYASEILRRIFNPIPFNPN